jgi:hypothetical protein
VDETFGNGEYIMGMVNYAQNYEQFYSKPSENISPKFKIRMSVITKTNVQGTFSGELLNFDGNLVYTVTEGRFNAKVYGTVSDLP